MTDSRRQMLETNRRQRSFYEAKFEADESSTHTRKLEAGVFQLWNRLRSVLKKVRRDLGMEDYIRSLHRDWLADSGGGEVLDLGCFDGNPLSLWIAQQSQRYVGVDLSRSAILSWHRELREHNVESAYGIPMDILRNAFRENQFDAIYARSVLHHFEDLQPVLVELGRIMKPGGRLVTLDPLQTEPINRVVRMLFSRFRADDEWEWPLDRESLATIRTHFSAEDVRGIHGVAKVGYPLYLLPLCRPLGRLLSRKGFEIDRRLATSAGSELVLHQCWQVTMLLRSDPEESSSKSAQPRSRQNT